mgnify:CR=1 FL=1
MSMRDIVETGENNEMERYMPWKQPATIMA